MVAGFVDVAERKEKFGCGGVDLNHRPLGYEGNASSQAIPRPSSHPPAGPPKSHPSRFLTGLRADPAIPQTAGLGPRFRKNHLTQKFCLAAIDSLAGAYSYQLIHFRCGDFAFALIKAWWRFCIFWQDLRAQKRDELM